MGLLAAGSYASSGDRTVQAASPSGQTTGSNSGAMQPPGIQNEPKRYQPSNPGTDTRVAPTQSDTGAGNAAGSTGNPVSK